MMTITTMISTRVKPFFIKTPVFTLKKYEFSRDVATDYDSFDGTDSSFRILFTMSTTKCKASATRNAPNNAGELLQTRKSYGILSMSGALKLLSKQQTKLPA